MGNCTIGREIVFLIALHPTPRLDAGQAPLLAARFRELGIDRSFIRRMTERSDDLRSPLRPTREALLVDDPAAAALLLFFCGEALTSERAGLALGSALFNVARESGLLIVDGDGSFLCPFHVRLVRDLYLFSDYLRISDSADDQDRVMGAGETTAILFQAACPRERVGRLLDLGCGAGTLALLLARDADHAVGTDLNPRAIEISRLNAALNGIGNVEFRVGSLYEPVAGETFDVIVSQPPYYPNSSGASLTFLHGGTRGDELARAIVQGVPGRLSKSGSAYVFASWPRDAEPRILDGFDVLELHTNRRELHGTRQSLNVIRSAEGRGWSRQFEVSAECWGRLEPSRIEQIFEIEGLLGADRSHLLAASLRLPDGVSKYREGEQLLLQYPPASLVGCVAVDDATWRVLASAHAAATVGAAGFNDAEIGLLIAAMRRGLVFRANG